MALLWLVTQLARLVSTGVLASATGSRSTLQLLPRPLPVAEP